MKLLTLATDRLPSITKRLIRRSSSTH